MAFVCATSCCRSVWGFFVALSVAFLGAARILAHVSTPDGGKSGLCRTNTETLT